MFRSSQYSDLSNPALDVVRLPEPDVRDDADDPDFSEAFRYHRRYRSAILIGVAAVLVGGYVAYLQPLRQEVVSTRADATHWRTKFGEVQDQAVALNMSLVRANAATAALKTELESERHSARAAEEKKAAALAKAKSVLKKHLGKDLARRDVVLQEKNGELVLSLVDKALFAPGQASLNRDGMRLIRNVGSALIALEKQSVEVSGHTDTSRLTGRMARRFPTNWELSGARAATVVRVLEERCRVPGTRLNARAYGSTRPVADNATRVGRSRNRRVEIVIGS